jgi:molybdopterin-guanine dinucleotide biosynthesis protein A
MRTGAIILTGGWSQRMGRPKESLPLHGDTILGRTAKTVCAGMDAVVVVARDPQQQLPALPPQVARVHDEVPGLGPLGGLVTGMRWLLRDAGFETGDAAFVTACDQPFLYPGAVQWLVAQLGEHELVMPRTGGLLQPLCAVYRLSVLPFAERLLATGTVTPRSLAAAAGARILDEDEVRAFDSRLEFLQNVNTPEDYRRALGGT